MSKKKGPPKKASKAAKAKSAKSPKGRVSGY